MTGPDRKGANRWDVRLRARIEDAFGDWGHFSAAHPWAVAAPMIALALVLSVGLPELRVETSVENFLRRSNPARAAYEDFRDLFGREEMILLAVEPPGGVFERDFLERLRRLHEAIEEEVPHLDEVRSLINARHTAAVGDALVVGALFEEWPETDEALEEIEAIARANPLYVGQILSRDGSMTTLLIRTNAYSAQGAAEDALAGFEDEAAEAGPEAEPAYLSGEENSEAVRAVLGLIERFGADDFPIRIAGGPVMADQLAGELGRNIRIFMSLCILAVAILLFMLFRRISAVLLPLVVVLFSILSTFGLMALVDQPLGVPTQILPSFLLAVGVGGGVHLLTIFFIHFDEGVPKAEALSRALHHAGLAIVMTSLTTAVGLLSFVTAEIEPVAALGVFAPVGIGMGMFYCLGLLPALIAIVPLAPKPGGQRRLAAIVDTGLLKVGGTCVRNPWATVLSMSAILVFAIVGITRLEFHYDPLTWLPDGSPLRVGTDYIDEKLEGSLTLEMLIDTGRPGGLRDPAVLRALETLAVDVTAIEGEQGLRAGKALSLADVVAEIHFALNEERPEMRIVPDDRELVAQELLLFEGSGSDDLESLTEASYQLGRFSIMLPYSPPLIFESYIEDVDEAFERRLDPSIEVEATGIVTLLTRALNAIMVSMMRSYLFALVIITPLMFLLLGHLRTGLASMIPNLAPIVITLGLMGWLGIPLDLFTLLIGSIAIGLAVDDTIHFMHNFRKDHDKHGDTLRAVQHTLRTTGRALLTTSVVLAVAFFTYGFAEFRNLQRFGLLTGFTIVVAFIADVTISPAVLELATRPARRLFVPSSARSEEEGCEGA